MTWIRSHFLRRSDPISNQDASRDLNWFITFCTFFFSLETTFIFFEEMTRALESTQARGCQYQGSLLFWEDYPGATVVGCWGTHPLTALCWPFTQG